MVRKYGRHRYQIIFVDWGKTAFSPLYFPSAVNAQVVADVVSAFIRTLVDLRDAKTRTFHLIGFSLGAHISGFVGKRLKGKYRLNRITGLDPASPLFEGTPSSRIDKGDADFVEIIHTYSGSFISGFSILDAIGTVDFYVNGGQRQPGCSDPPFGAITGSCIRFLLVLEVFILEP
ncbi:pancreatic lipase-related protein 2-like protein [Leptotrombidium deliense]|uniref:Pancreatic lipase-related protein 2-like protein n=1 Tax=Leptotrombidium deliense TaxID=299467 RepID=A0A443SQ44_9ACAR|nr:pancreatic lipase-related protein 2-like protein [Leptotrombidium deliense]